MIRYWFLYCTLVFGWLVGCGEVFTPTTGAGGGGTGGQSTSTQGGGGDQPELIRLGPPPSCLEKFSTWGPIVPSDGYADESGQPIYEHNSLAMYRFEPPFYPFTVTKAHIVRPFVEGTIDSTVVMFVYSDDKYPVDVDMSEAQFQYFEESILAKVTNWNWEGEIVLEQGRALYLGTRQQAVDGKVTVFGACFDPDTDHSKTTFYSTTVNGMCSEPPMVSLEPLPVSPTAEIAEVFGSKNYTYPIEIWGHGVSQ